jgi:hypothetical protein
MESVREAVREERQVSGFDRVSFGGHGELTIAQGERESLTVEAEADVLPRIRTEVRDGTLHIEFTDRKWWRNLVRHIAPIRFELTVRELRGFGLSGAGTVRAAPIRTDTFGLDVSGAGKISFESLEADTFKLNLSGAGKCVLAGNVNRQTIGISGAGKYDGADLESREADVSVSGAGSIRISVSDRLDARISGTGKIEYFGSPSVDKRVSGIGKIVALGER